MEKKYYIVEIEAITNKSIEVEAESETEAIEKANKLIQERKVFFDEHKDCDFDEIIAHMAHEQYKI